jgi:hypothetical protein
MKKYITVSEFLGDLDQKKLAQVNELRKIILDTEPSLTENIKWNSPNYVFGGEDRLTINLLNKEQKVKLVLHMGAVRKEDKKAKPILKDDGSLIEWNSNIRGNVTFNNLGEIQTNRVLLSEIIKKWLAIT